MRQIIELATRNQQKAWEIIRQTDIENSWRSTGADINLVGFFIYGAINET